MLGIANKLELEQKKCPPVHGQLTKIYSSELIARKAPRRSSNGGTKALIPAREKIPKVTIDVEGLLKVDTDAIALPGTANQTS